MENTFKLATARIHHGENGAVCGAGFLITPQYVVTCAHVVTAALDHQQQHAAISNRLVDLDFPFRQASQRVQAELALLLPPLSDSNAQPQASEDIAVLRLLNPLELTPNELPFLLAEPLPVGTIADSFGFPHGHDRGTPVRGKVAGGIAGGCVIIEAEKDYGYFVAQGFSGAPVWSVEAGGIFGMIVSADVSRHAAYLIPADILVERISRVQSFVKQAKVYLPQLANLSQKQTDECPYRGLEVFEEKHAHLFFGRDGFADALLQKVQQHSFVTVVGPSGSGKSSIVRAGLLPRLRREHSTQSLWGTVIFTPGKTPFYNLAFALVSTWENKLDKTEQLLRSEKLGAGLANGKIRLEAAFDFALKSFAGANKLLVVIDQFEEPFTLTNERERKAFVESLLSVSTLPQTTIVLTLRADFWGQAVGFSRELGELITQEPLNILPMNRSELCEAIEMPACRAGLRFEDGLIERILDAVENQPGHLPLLQFALKELWCNRRFQLLCHKGYEEIGEIKGAIGQRAEHEFNQLPRSLQKVAEGVLTRLVHVADVTEEGGDTRQRLRLNGLDEDSSRVIKAFTDARLLVTNRVEVKLEATGKIYSEEIAEVAHEALIRNWQRLRELLNRDRQFFLWRQSLGLMLNEWQRTKRDNGVLLRGALLDEAKSWDKEREKDLNQQERKFIQQSELAMKKPLRRLAIAVVVSIALTLAGLGWKRWDDRDESQINKLISQSFELVKPEINKNQGADFLDAKMFFQSLVISGRLSELLNAAKQIPENGDRFLIFFSITEALFKIERPIEALLVADEALKAAGEVEDEFTRFNEMFDIVNLLIKNGKTNEAQMAAIQILKAARGFSSPSLRSHVMEKIVEPLLKTGNTKDAHLAAHEAFKAAKGIGDLTTRSQMMANIIEPLTRAGKTQEAQIATSEALQAASDIENISACSQVTASLVEPLAKGGKTNEAQMATSAALEIASKINNSSELSWTMANIAERLAKGGKPNEAKIAAKAALTAADKVRKPSNRSWCLATIVEPLAKGGQTDQVKIAINQAIKESSSDADQQIAVRSEIQRALENVDIVETDLVNEARTLAEALDDAKRRSFALASIVSKLANAGKVNEAEQVAQEINDEAIHSKAMADIIDKLPIESEGDLGKAVDKVNTIRLAYFHSIALSQITGLLIKNGNYKQAKELLNDAIQYAAKTTGRENSKCLARIAKGLAKLHLYKQARETANRCSFLTDRFAAYAAILQAYQIEHHPKHAKLFDELNEEVSNNNSKQAIR